MEQVVEKRQAARHRMLKTAKIVFNNKGSVIDCVLRNLSETGAGVRLDGPAAIPDTVDLLIDGQLRPCRKVRQAGLVVGLAFV